MSTAIGEGIELRTFVVGFLSTDCYLVYRPEDGRAFLVDPGRGFQRIKSFADEQHLRIEAVLLTHGHCDHILEAKRWQDEGAKVYVHRLDAPKLEGKGHLGDMIGLNVPPLSADVVLEDGDCIDPAGVPMTVLHTPGHSTGSCCYVGEGFMFSGDTLFCGDIGRSDFPDSDPRALQQSLERIKAIRKDLQVFPGHGEATTLERERRNNPYLR